MRIESPLPEPYLVDDYDFHFSSGLTMSFSIAKDLGDTIDFDTSPMAVQLHFAEKPSTTDPDATVPPEDITVLMQHVLLVAHRTRTVQPPSREEKDNFQRSLHKLGKTVQ